MGLSGFFGLKDVWKEGYHKLGDKYLALLKECAAMKTELRQSDNALRRVNGDYFETRAERDELQRRLDAVVADARRWADSACYCDFDRHGDRTLMCEYCEQSTQLAAIAGGTQP